MESRISVKVEVINGYINFFVNNKKLVENVLEEVEEIVEDSYELDEFE